MISFILNFTPMRISLGEKNGEAELTSAGGYSKKV